MAKGLLGNDTVDLRCVVATMMRLVPSRPERRIIEMCDAATVVRHLISHPIRSHHAIRARQAHVTDDRLIPASPSRAEAGGRRVIRPRTIAGRCACLSGTDGGQSRLAPPRERSNHLFERLIQQRAAGGRARGDGHICFCRAAAATVLSAVRTTTALTCSSHILLLPILYCAAAAERFPACRATHDGFGPGGIQCLHHRHPEPCPRGHPARRRQLGLGRQDAGAGERVQYLLHPARPGRCIRSESVRPTPDRPRARDADTTPTVRYWQLKGGIAGEPFKIPFVGPFHESVKPSFEKYYAKWLTGTLSCVSVFHKFVIIASNRDMSRKVFNSPTYVKPCVVDVASKLLRPENWVFLDGKEHVEYRKGLNGLFTRQALETYLPGQQEVYREYFEEFLQMSRERQHQGQPFVYKLRELMCAVSCRTFVGHYMSREGVKRIADDYYNITAAMELVNFPIIIPYTKTWYGKKAADAVIEAFSQCAAKARVRMRQKGAEPECIVDRWLLQMIASERYRERVARGEKVPDEEKPAMLLRNFSDYEISMTVMTFLFASQDATSSACSWMLQLLADRPEMLAHVREEAKAIRPDPSKPVTMDMLENMVSFTIETPERERGVKESERERERERERVCVCV